MTALLGPNEAGKTSVLRLLLHINHDEAFADDEYYRYDPSVKPKLDACFFLEEADCVSISSQVPKRLIIKKTADGTREFFLEPRIIKDRSARRLTVSRIKEILSKPVIVEALSSSQRSEFDQKCDDFNFDAENLPEDDVKFLEEVSESIQFDDQASMTGDLVALNCQINDLVEYEKQSDPNDDAIAILKQRVPEVLEFSAEDRKLDYSYNIGLINHANAAKPCEPLKKIAEGICDLNLRELKGWMDNGRDDRIKKAFRDAEKKLNRAFHGAWSQKEKLSIELNWSKPNIQIMVKEWDENEEEYIGINERSDGFKQYVALFAFMMNRDADVPPILLIDEAELHLHYDAQADLIQTLTKKDIAAKIIYTTHSAGCLPEDLGTGVKLVKPIEDVADFSTSKIENKFWNSDALGFSPILYGMGANTLAFFPTRKAVVVEGHSDPFIMPTVFRQVSEQEYNQFQVVPGISNLSSKDAPLLALQGTRVIYLVDNDGGGETLRKQLEGARVNPKYILKISSKEDVITVEDWIDDQVFAVAMSRYYDSYLSGKERFSDGFFNGFGKAAKLKEYGEKIGSQIQKTDLAYFVLEAVEGDHDFKIYEESLKNGILELRNQIQSLFEDSNV